MGKDESVYPIVLVSNGEGKQEGSTYQAMVK